MIEELTTHRRQVAALRDAIRGLDRAIVSASQESRRPRLVAVREPDPTEPYVLVLEDDPQMQRVLALSLERDAHVVVRSACSIPEATETIQRHGNAIEAALLDWVIEDGDPWNGKPAPCGQGSTRPCALASALQSQGVPVAIITGYPPADTPDLERFIADSGVTVFRKGATRKNEPGFFDQVREWVNRQRRLRQKRATS